MEAGSSDPADPGSDLAAVPGVVTRPRRLDPADYRGYRARIPSRSARAYNRTRPFTDADTVHHTLRQFLRVAAQQQVEVLAYCFMPDHLHLIVIAHGANTDLQRFVRLAKQCSGFAFTRATGHRLWQDSYFNHTVRNVEELPVLIEYSVSKSTSRRTGPLADGLSILGIERYSREELLEYVASARRV